MRPYHGPFITKGFEIGFWRQILTSPEFERDAYTMHRNVKTYFLSRNVFAFAAGGQTGDTFLTFPKSARVLKCAYQLKWINKWKGNGTSRYQGVGDSTYTYRSLSADHQAAISWLSVWGTQHTQQHGDSHYWSVSAESGYTDGTSKQRFCQR